MLNNKITQGYNSRMRYDLLADWELNIFCNFSCEYCFYSKDRKAKNKKYAGHENIEQIVDFFDKSGRTWLIHMSGGEPFIHPRFIELCSKLTKKHYISINTNLTSSSIKNFIETIDPSRVAFIHCALHYEERRRHNLINSFIDKFNKLKSRNYNSFVSQTLYPPSIDNFEAIFTLFKNENIAIRPKAFSGFVGGKQYPAAYTNKEKELLAEYSGADSQERVSLFQMDQCFVEKYITGDLSFKGLPCDAGKTFVRIKYNGDIVRCHASKKPLGNIFKGIMTLSKKAELCPFHQCPCRIYGLTYAYGVPKTNKSSRFAYLKQQLKNIEYFCMKHFNFD
jgi:MoaA/NifB/PqqE/SkfB family radical SAM enzyme